MSKLRQKLSIALPILLIGVLAFFVAYISKTTAATNNFVQTDWQTGADTNATADSANLSNWAKYYSATTGVITSVAGEIKLKVEKTP